MRKPSSKRTAFLIERNKKAERRKYFQNLKRRIARTKSKVSEKGSRSKLGLERRRLALDLYKRREIKDGFKAVEISGDFGIEEDSDIKRYLEKAVEVTDFEERELRLDLTNCTRIWPSGITFFCSLLHWVELCTDRNDSPKISSSDSKEGPVNSYLAHCGFYKYVNRQSNSVTTYYSDSEIVKIRREKRRSNIEKREDEILNLIQQWGSFSTNELDEFSCVVLIEIFNNVVEHGIPSKDNGWWILAQNHPSHKIISLCVADNGIGFRNNLLTGPQKDEVIDLLGAKANNEGEFIRLALREHVSGALTASVKERRIISKKLPRGAKRGNGLKRISATCKKLGIKLSILSHHGYLFLDENGNERECGNSDKRVYAGTLYNLVIPTSRIRG